ncbi:MAG TPA: hypothetical protein VFM18_18860 [Methanosarcina sp.]|nr:hypothetical protein [Methanosarcina sp.]
MILNNTPENQAVLSNVGEIGEFRIRNSAKAFSILSSGLYANKIRAIIRELSCNAVDSHVAAGKADTPFDVHLPSQLEPWFAIRDYGTGLDADQVKNIYTTYFESTKTDSNAFIGALGLGSKSPFSYTDNFTVTAIKDGVKRIYSAFINGEGVPSVALMATEESTDPNGVEVKFSVNDRHDFYKFRDEAKYVYTYFTLRPVVSGDDDFKVHNIAYETKDIVPGISTMKGHHYRGNSVAVMGNIPYPIDVPNAHENLGSLAHLLNCGLEIRFEIGEVDFQASREGLSYIPSTIESIKRKLELLAVALEKVLAKEANAIKNEWHKAHWLLEKYEHGLWSAAAELYIKNTKFDLVVLSGRGARAQTFAFATKQLETDFNIKIGGFYKYHYSSTCSELRPKQDYDWKNNTQVLVKEEWHFPISDDQYFVVTDTKVGAMARAKHHWRNTAFPENRRSTHNVYVLSAADATKPIDSEGFFKALRTPPADLILKASQLLEKERKKRVGGQDVTVLSLQSRDKTYRDTELVWRDAGRKADKFDAKDTFYYLPMSGFSVQTDKIHIRDVKEFYYDIKKSAIGLSDIALYGVRKADIEFIKTQPNWVNIQTKLQEIFGNMSETKMEEYAMRSLDLEQAFQYNQKVADLIESTSPYSKFTSKGKQVKGEKFDRDTWKGFNRLMDSYGDKDKFKRVVEGVKNDSSAVKTKYRLLDVLQTKGYIDPAALAEYINLIDAKE